MNKVYIVYVKIGGRNHICSIYDSEEKANKHVKEAEDIRIDGYRKPDTYWIEPWEVH